MRGGLDLGVSRAVADDLEYAFKAGGGDDVQELFGQRVPKMGRVADGLHVLIGVFDLDTHQFIDEVMKARAVGRVEQQPEFVEVVVYVVHKLHRAAVGVFRHVGGRRGAVHAVELLLNFQKALCHLVQRRLDDGRKQPLLIAETDVDGICAGVGGRGDSA